MNLPKSVATQIVAKPCFTGFLKIWKHDVKTGASELILDKKNTILYTGADILANCLAGKANSRISHIYLSYADTLPESYTVTKDVSEFIADETRGYLRLPLSFPATYTTSDAEVYDHNVVVFTAILNNPSGLIANTGGAIALASGTSKFFEAGLASAYNPTDTGDEHPSDKVFSRITFDELVYDSSFNLTISWGINFTS